MDPQNHRQRRLTVLIGDPNLNRNKDSNSEISNNNKNLTNINNKLAEKLYRTLCLAVTLIDAISLMRFNDLKTARAEC